MYIPAFSTNCGFHESIYLLFLHTKYVTEAAVEHIENEYWILFNSFFFRFSPYKIKLTFAASMSKHKKIKCYSKNCNRVYQIGSIVAKKKITNKIYERFFSDCSVVDQVVLLFGSANFKSSFFEKFGELSTLLCAAWLQNCHQLV